MIVRMTKRARVRNVRRQDVPRMQQNGWAVADDPPKRKRQPKPTEPPEKDSGGSSLPENTEES